MLMISLVNYDCTIEEIIPIVFQEKLSSDIAFPLFLRPRNQPPLSTSHHKASSVIRSIIVLAKCLANPASLAHSI